ncbi:hypothetical protein CMT19_00970 [Elizabethkingia anophelis]|nr:hypothetical protein [Elizabethkingia anophelis]
MIITTAIVTALLLKLGEKGLEKAFETGGEKLSEGAINWIKGLFFKDGIPKKALRELQETPENIRKQEIVKSIIENSIEDDENNLKYFEELVSKLPSVQNKILSSKNIIAGNVNVDGNSIIGDGNTMTQNIIKSIVASRPETIFFQKDESRKETFTFLELIKNSLHYYIIMVVILVIMGLYSYYFFPNEQALKTSLIICLCIIFIYFMYLYYNRKRLPQVKFPHKILYLILFNKFSVGTEIPFNEIKHLSIYRNSLWNFTFNKRSANCIKKGCSGKVYLHKFDDYNFIGRCEIDEINHTYKVDKNFYGEEL